ncbi:MAG: class I SAM-dependent methyltransferase [Alphaproteobacteria bacterium]|nr:class I SAM-dependent methyltransferase [Alphaproteobacteria bacterium]
MGYNVRIMAHKMYRSIARFYDLLDLPFERGRYAPIRPVMFTGLSGRVLDAGVGTGRNMGFYPAGAHVTGIDLSAAMLSRAVARRDRLGIEVQLLERDVCDTGLPDGHFDAAVATFLFCVLDDSLQLPALKELSRIVRPGGEIRILEYQYSAWPWKRFVMHLWAPWVRLAYGATFDRNTEQYLPGAGLEIVEERMLFEDIIKLIVARAPG